MRAENGDFYVGSGANDGDNNNVGAPRQKPSDDGSFHSPAWQEHYIKSLTAINRPVGNEATGARRSGKHTQLCSRRTPGAVDIVPP